MSSGDTILYLTDLEKTVAYYEPAFGLNRTFWASGKRNRRPPASKSERPTGYPSFPPAR